MRNRSNAVPTDVTQSLPLVRAANLWAGGNLTEEEVQWVKEACIAADQSERLQSMVEFKAIMALCKEHGFPPAKASAAVKRYFTR